MASIQQKTDELRASAQEYEGRDADRRVQHEQITAAMAQSQAEMQRMIGELRQSSDTTRGELQATLESMNAQVVAIQSQMEKNEETKAAIIAELDAKRHIMEQLTATVQQATAAATGDWKLKVERMVDAMDAWSKKRLRLRPRNRACELGPSRTRLPPAVVRNKVAVAAVGTRLTRQGSGHSVDLSTRRI